MYYFTMRFQINNYDNFKKTFDSFEEERKSQGISTVKLLKNIEDSSQIFILFEAPSLEVIKERMGNTNLHKRWADAGMIGKPEVNIYTY